jgi:hypothetical protein
MARGRKPKASTPKEIVDQFDGGDDEGSMSSVIDQAIVSDEIEVDESELVSVVFAKKVNGKDLTKIARKKRK